MARRPSISDEQILEAARECFHDRGLSATTAEIAERAGISEGSIFRRYSTKTELFHAAMAESSPPWFETLEQIEGTGDLRVNLERLIDEMMTDFERVVRRFSIMIAFAAQSDYDMTGEEIPVRIVRRLVRFFDAEKSAGRIGDVDSELLTRVMLGSLHHYTYAEVHGVNKFFDMSRNLFIRSIVDLILRAAEPPVEPREKQENHTDATP